MTIDWYIDGVCLNKELGLFFAESAGIVDLLKPKKAVVANYPNLHGEEVDLSDRVYESRDLTFKCFMSAPGGPQDLEYRLGRLGSLLGLKRLVRLDIHMDHSYWLSYIVYAPDVLRVKKEFDHDITAEFSLLLREPNPVKRIYRTTNKTISITPDSGDYPLLISYSPVSSPVKALPTKNVAITHTYDSDERCIVVVAGRLDIVKLTVTNLEEICAYLN